MLNRKPGLEIECVESKGCGIKPCREVLMKDAIKVALWEMLDPVVLDLDP